MCKNLSLVLTVFELTVKLPWRNKQQKGQYAKAIFSSVLWQVAYYAAWDKENNHPTMLYCSIFGYLYSVCQIKSHMSSERSRCLQHSVFCTGLEAVLYGSQPHNKPSSWMIPAGVSMVKEVTTLRWGDHILEDLITNSFTWFEKYN